MNKLIERLIKIPLATKVAVAVAAIAALTAGNYFLIISDIEDQITRRISEKKKLEKDLVDKKVIADNLNQFKRDKEVLDRLFAEAKTELPTSKEIDELLRQLNDVGKKSGLEINSLVPGNETPATFYASIPIKMQVAGSYHEIAVFFESISKLRRIINVTNIKFGSPKRLAEKVVLTADYTATTFRFLDAPASAAKKAGK